MIAAGLSTLKELYFVNICILKKFSQLVSIQYNNSLFSKDIHSMI